MATDRGERGNSKFKPVKTLLVASCRRVSYISKQNFD